MKSLLVCNLVDMPEVNPQMRFFQEIHRVLGNRKMPYVDRTGTIDCPLRFYTLARERLLPEYFDRDTSFQDCVESRVRELVHVQDRVNKPILLAYSGGLDSTAVICSFIQQLGVQETARRIEILLDVDSILEYPRFYHEFLLPHFSLTPSSKFGQRLPPDYIMLDGDPACLTIQADWMIKNWKRLGEDFFSQDWGMDSVHEISRTVSYQPNELTPRVCQAVVDMVMITARAVGIEITNNLDAWWWINMNFRWMFMTNIHLRRVRAYSNTVPIDEQFHYDYFTGFFNSQDFVCWSKNHRWDQVEWMKKGLIKLPLKQLILEVTGDQIYYRTKGKVPSLNRPLRFDPFVFGVNDQFQIVNQSDINQYVMHSNFIAGYL